MHISTSSQALRPSVAAPEFRIMPADFLAFYLRGMSVLEALSIAEYSIARAFLGSRARDGPCSGRLTKTARTAGYC